MVAVEEDAFRYDSRVAVVTGAGRGLGRAYALFLADRGAKVVVNDVGAELDGGGGDDGPACEVVEEIRSRGGEAIASFNSVATEVGGAAIIDVALATWGRIDILVQNAGNSRRASVLDMCFDDFDAIVKVHLYGAFNVARPAFKAMCHARYGRIVLTSSAVGLYGARNAIGYATCKAGATAMSSTLAIEGAEYGVLSNCILPGAITRVSEGLDTSGFPSSMQPEHVAPMVGWLAHERCNVSGENFIALADRLACARWIETQGRYRDGWSPAAIECELAAIKDPRAVWSLPALTGFPDHMSRSMAMSAGAAPA